jgi:cytochrome c biogenesis protein
MTVSSQGIELQTRSRVLRSTVELLSSMRFAIALFVLICVAAIIGTILKQQVPFNNYVNQFGPFWAEVFGALSLYHVYSAWWFLLILLLLVSSTSLCIARNAPKIVADLRAYKENIREQSLQAFGQRAHTVLTGAPQEEAQRIGRLLASGGWKVKLQERSREQGGSGWMVAAKKGVANKLGYIAAHSAIVLICVGGLLDGDLILRAQMLLQGKTPYLGGGLLVDVPAQHRLSESNPTFRANLLVSEGQKSSTAIVNQSSGILLQDLPFAIELKKFVVEYYSTGMPKLFASDIVIHDKATGAKTPARVEVNHPVNYKGIEIYQSSFDDGGSSVTLRAIPMDGTAQPFDVQGVIGGSTRLAKNTAGDEDQLTVEYTGLRVINVENFSADTTSETDVRKVDLRRSLESSLGAANKSSTKKDLRNVGPSISYKLRDSAGQAREYNNYMLPVDLGDGVPVFLLGVRDSPAENFRYVRIPADDKGSMDDFVHLRTALADPAMRKVAIQRYVKQAVDPQRKDLAAQLEASAGLALNVFAQGFTNASGAKTLGLQAVSDFLEQKVPDAERSKAGEVLVRILNGTLYELAQLSREKAGLSALGVDARVQAFMTQSVMALSDLGVYPAPFALQLTDFTHVQASVFQVASAPGKTVVYLGCALLIVGVFAMLYVRERRVWVWLTPSAPSHEASIDTVAMMALSTNRKTMDGDHEFEHLKHRLLHLKEDSDAH